MQKRLIDDDWCCEHGTALDVHCCNCHSGFLFDIDSCVCSGGEQMQIMKIQQKPIILEAIKWEANEAEVRAFVQDDKALRFLDRGLEIWNSETESWIRCDTFSYITKNSRGNLDVISPRELETNYSIVE